MLSILLPAARRGAVDDQTVWGDVRVALASIAAYAPGVDVVLAWSGAAEPRDLPPNPLVRMMQQPGGITTASQAWNWCATQTDADELVILGDDVVLHPDTVELLLADVAFLRREVHGQKLGVVGARSNYVKGPQNIRNPNGGALQGNSMFYDSEASIVPTTMVVPVAAWIERAAFELVGGFPPTNWFGDDLLCWDLAQRGYRHFVSRAYVHHVGQRSTAQGKGSRELLEEGLAWLREHRPDFYELVTRDAAAPSGG
ncbi:MAG: hypothetical protein U0V73_03155 [Acidimicrobiia bacterium]